MMAELNYLVTTVCGSDAANLIFVVSHRIFERVLHCLRGYFTVALILL